MVFPVEGSIRAKKTCVLSRQPEQTHGRKYIKGCEILFSESQKFSEPRLLKTEVVCICQENLKYFLIYEKPACLPSIFPPSLSFFSASPRPPPFFKHSKLWQNFNYCFMPIYVPNVFTILKKKYLMDLIDLIDFLLSQLLKLLGNVYAETF